MPLSYALDAPNRLVRVAATEHPEIPEWFDMMERIFREPGFERGFDIFVDRTDLDVVPTSADVRMWVHQHSELVKQRGSGRVAIVAREPVLFGLMRMAAVFAEEYDLKLAVFWEEPEALAWLGRSLNAVGATERLPA